MGNHNSGRRPQPTALTILRGNPSKKKLNENEPCPPSGEVTKPTGLSAGAATVWDELAPICLAMGTLTVADRLAFTTLCELQASMVEASKSKVDRGHEVFRLDAEDRMDPNSAMVVIIDAALKLEIATAAALRPYYEYFGLTPASRARISVKKPKDEPVSKWAGLK